MSDNSCAIVHIIDFLLDHYVIYEGRQAQYLSDELLELIQKKAKRKTTAILTGSCAEGMQNSGDKDVMVQSSLYIAVESVDQIPKNYQGGILLIDTTDCYPGFTKLLLHEMHEKEDSEINAELFQDCDGKKYLNRIKYLNYVYKIRMGSDLPLHGPALLLEERGSDYVTCFGVPIWPKSAANTLTRHRYLPSEETMKKISSNGCHIVAVPYPKSKNPDVEFRISFSVAEKLLIRKWTATQIRLYFLCKELFHELFNADGHSLEKGLCSYFAKTIIFWMIEKYPDKYWIESSIINLLDEFFNTLTIYLTNRSCSNYFIPENYMMSSYTEYQGQQLLEKVKMVTNNLPLYILSCGAIKLLLGSDWEILISLYNIMISISNVNMMEEILGNIYETIKHHHVQEKTKTRLLTESYNSTFSDFMVLCQTHAWIYEVNPVTILLSVGQDLEDKFSKIYDPVLCSYFENCVERSMAHHALHGACAKIDLDKDKRASLFVLSGRFLVSSSTFTGLLNDYKMTGNVYLGIFFKASGFPFKALNYFDAAITSRDKLYVDGQHYAVPALPVVITSYNNKAPNFFADDDILCDLLEKRHVHQVEFDPLVLALYMKYRMTRDCDVLESFKRIERYNYHLKSDGRQMSSALGLYNTTKESYQYLKYRLGLLDPKSEVYTRYLNDPVTCYECKE